MWKWCHFSTFLHHSPFFFPLPIAIHKKISVRIKEERKEGIIISNLTILFWEIKLLFCYYLLFYRSFVSYISGRRYTRSNHVSLQYNFPHLFLPFTSFFYLLKAGGREGGRRRGREEEGGKETREGGEDQGKRGRGRGGEREGEERSKVREVEGGEERERKEERLTWEKLW